MNQQLELTYPTGTPSPSKIRAVDQTRPNHTYNLPYVRIQLVRDGVQRWHRKEISNPGDAAKLSKEVISDSDREKLFILMLDTKNRVLGIHVCSEGDLSSSIVHPREVFKAAILANACSIILVHNHPSGDPTPSAEDVHVTKRLYEVGELIGIELRDHIIIGEHDEFKSLKALGRF
jgi:DNA repair protein RadC